MWKRGVRSLLVGALIGGLASAGTALATEDASATPAVPVVGFLAPSSSAPSSSAPSSSAPSSSAPFSSAPFSSAPFSSAPSSSARSSAPTTPPSSSVVKEPAPKITKTHRYTGPAGSMMTTGGAGVALTFDDGPDPVQTPRLLDYLAERHVKATFCVVGQNVRAHPELVRRIVAEGHTLCNHTWRHSLTLGRQKPATIRADLQRTNDAIRAAAPGAVIKYMRAPGGNFTPAFVTAAADLGMTSIYWHVDPRDWDHPAGESDAAHQSKIIRNVERHVHQGSIVLSHDMAQPDTIAAYRVLVPWLQRRYELVGLP